MKEKLGKLGLVLGVTTTLSAPNVLYSDAIKKTVDDTGKILELNTKVDNYKKEKEKLQNIVKESIKSLRQEELEDKEFKKIKLDFENRIKDLKKQKEGTEDEIVKKKLIKDIKNLTLIYDYVVLNYKTAVKELDFSDIKNIEKNYSLYLINLKILDYLRTKNIDGLKEIAGIKDDGGILFSKIEQMRKYGGLNSDQITEILKISAGVKNGSGAFSTIRKMREYGGLNSNQITEILKISAASYYGYLSFAYIKDIKFFGGLNSDQITEVLKIAVGSYFGDEVFSYIKDIKKHGIDLLPILKELAGTKKHGYKIFSKIDRVKESVGFNEDSLIKIFNGFLGNNYVGFKKEFFSDYSMLNVSRERIYLGKEFKRYKDLFEDGDSFNKFIEQILINTSLDISKSLNDVYDYYEEPERNFSYGTKNDKIGARTINGQIKEKLNKYSTEELLSLFGNHAENYSTTFNLVLIELDLRLKKEGYNNYFSMIDNNKNLTDKAKIYLKGQLITGLLARGKEKKVISLLENKQIFDIISRIIDYKNSDIFELSTYLGLMVGLKNIIKIDKRLQKYIYLNYFKKEKNNKFRRALIIALGLEGKKLTEEGIGVLNDEEKENLKHIKDSFNLDSKELYSRKIKDMVYIYGGNTLGGGINYYYKEINVYKEKYKYKVINEGNGFIVLEKKGIRVTFINYDKIDSVKDIFNENKLNPIMMSFRGHNYITSEMIANLKEFLIKNKDTIIMDGGCRNISVITDYRDKGIENQIIAYTDTGKGSATFNFTSVFISEYLRKLDYYKDKEITLKELSSKILPDRDYAKEFMKFPGDLMDIVLRIEKGYYI